MLESSGQPSVCATKPGICAVQLLARDEVLGERAARTFGQHGNFGAQLVAGREVGLGLATAIHSLIAGNDAGDSLAFVDELGAGKFGKDVDAGLLDQAAKPLYKFVE
jgi:hypothetical protein